MRGDRAGGDNTSGNPRPETDEESDEEVDQDEDDEEEEEDNDESIPLIVQENELISLAELRSLTQRRRRLRSADFSNFKCWANFLKAGNDGSIMNGFASSENEVFPRTFESAISKGSCHHLSSNSLWT